jgi:flagellar protein FliO/FliZ
MLRMVVSLAIVLALMYVAARLLSRGRAPRPARQRQAQRPRATKKAGGSLIASLAGAAGAKRGRRVADESTRLELLSRQPLGKTAAVAVVRVGERTLLLGVTDSEIRLLSELGEPAENEILPDDPAAAGEKEAARQPLALVEPVVDAQPMSVLDILRERTVRRA